MSPLPTATRVCHRNARLDENDASASIVQRNLRRLGATLVALTLVALIASCDRGAQTSEGLYVPWNDPEAALSAQAAPRPTHSESDGFAVSRDGRFAAVALAGQAVNELVVVSLEDRSATMVIGTNPRVKLAHPALSSEGRYLAMVATPPTYFGIAEIWVTDLTNGSVVRIADGNRSYAYPTFSPNDLRLLYFKEPDRPIARFARRTIQPEYRALIVRYGLAEFDLRLSNETILESQNFLSPCGLAYAHDYQGGFACVGRQSVGPIGMDELDAWVRPRTFHVSWSDQADPMVREIDVAQLTGLIGARLEHSMQDGRLLFSGSRESNRGASPSVIVATYDDGRLLWQDVVSVRGMPLTAPRVLADGRVVGFRHRVVRPNIETDIITVEPNGNVLRLEQGDIQFVRTVHLEVEFGVADAESRSVR